MFQETVSELDEIPDELKSSGGANEKKIGDTKSYKSLDEKPVQKLPSKLGASPPRTNNLHRSVV